MNESRKTTRARYTLEFKQEAVREALTLLWEASDRLCGKRTAETRELRRVFTLDSHFRLYRAHDKESFEVVP